MDRNRLWRPVRRGLAGSGRVVAIAGAGATPALAERLGVELLAGNAVSEAAALTP